MKRKIVFITGGSASGKTTLAKQIIEHFGGRAILISQDSFYKPGDVNTNYDNPISLDFEKQKEILAKLKDGQAVEIPIYDFAQFKATGTQLIEPTEIIIFEGLFTLYDYQLSKLADFKIFVDTPADTRLSRRIIRDIEERGRDLHGVIKRWLEDVKPAYDTYIHPMKKYADIVVPWEKIRNRAIDALLVTIAHLNEDITKILKI